MTSIHRSAKWASFVRMARPVIEKSLPAPCVNPFSGPGCTGVVYPGEQFDVSHLKSHHLDPTQPLNLQMVGPAHRKCNRRAGAREGRAKQLTQKKKLSRLPTADSGW